MVIPSDWRIILSPGARVGVGVGRGVWVGSGVKVAEGITVGIAEGNAEGMGVDFGDAAQAENAHARIRQISNHANKRVDLWV